MSKHIQPIFIILNMKDISEEKKILKCHSNLTEGSAGFTCLEAVPKDDVTYS